MKRFGMYLMVFGVGVFVLPMFGLEWEFMTLLGGNETLIGLGSAVIGCVMFFLIKE